MDVNLIASLGPDEVRSWAERLIGEDFVSDDVLRDLLHNFAPDYYGKEED